MSILGAAAVGVLGAIAVGTIAAIDKTVEFETHILHLAQSAGTTTETMSGLAFTAKMVGVNGDEAALAMERFDKKLQGVGTNKATADLMAQFGIMAGTLQTSDQALMKISDRFSTMPDGIQKSGIAMQFFGKAGAAMIPILNLGAKGIQEFEQQAANMGLIVTKASAEAAEQFEQNAMRLEGYLKGLMRSFDDAAISIANSIHDAFTMKGGFGLTGAATSDADPGTQQEMAANLQKAADDQQAAIKAAAKAVPDMAIRDADAAAAAKKLAEAIKSVTDTLTRERDTIGASANEITRYKLAHDGASAAVLEHVRAMQSDVAVQTAFAKAAAESLVQLKAHADEWYNKQQIEIVKEMSDAITANIDALEKSTKTAGGQPDFISALGTIPALIAPIHQQVQDIIKDLTEQNRNLGFTSDEWVLVGLRANGASEAEIAAVHNAQAALLAHQQAVQTLADRWKEFGDVANRALDDLIFSGKKFTQVLQDVTKALGEMFLKWALFGNGKSGSGGGLFGMLGNLLGITGGGGGGGGGIDPGLNLGLGFASGGAASAGVPILVGEQGPEIFTPGMSGSIIPNSAIAPMMRSSSSQAGGVNLTYNIDARGADAGAEARIRKALQDTENNAVARALLLVRDTQLRTA
jgi:hypothetical protein